MATSISGSLYTSFLQSDGTRGDNLFSGLPFVPTAATDTPDKTQILAFNGAVYILYDMSLKKVIGTGEFCDD